MGILSWIVLGGIAGWLASIVMKRNDQMGCITNIIAGVVGASVGGWVLQPAQPAGCLCRRGNRAGGGKPGIWQEISCGTWGKQPDKYAQHWAWR